MQISDILKPEAVKTLGACSSKKRMFHDLSDIAVTAYGLETSVVFDALMERENLGPTGVGHGIALPHARIEQIGSVCGMFLRLEKPIDFDAVDRQPVDLVFALLAPEKAGVEHLKALALVSRTMRDPDMQAKLRANTDAATLHTILTENQAQAA